LTYSDYIKGGLRYSSADQDSFLPSAIQRYHQLFMPVLQLLLGMLASLGPKHTTAAHQVIIISISEYLTINEYIVAGP
jgi:nuclear pore complex protein Nup205